MKHLKLISSVLAASTAGTSLAKLGDAAFLADVSGETVFATALFLGILAFAAGDLARHIKPLPARDSPIRPERTGAGIARTSAYGVRRRSVVTGRTAV